MFIYYIQEDSPNLMRRQDSSMMSSRQDGKEQYAVGYTYENVD